MDMNDEISSKLQLPPAVVKMTQGTKKKFCNFVKGLDEEHEHHMNRSSLLGSYLIELNTSKKKEFFTSPSSSTKMSILCTILLSNDYTLCLDKQFKNTIKKTRERFSVLQSNETVEDDLLIKELVDDDKVLMRNNTLNDVKFATDDIRHQVMSYFIRTCLVTDEDYINYINLSSVDSLLEYVRVWGYENVEEERCLHLPERIGNIYIEKLDVHILCHVNSEMLCQKSGNLADKLNIPPAVLKMSRGTKISFCNFVKRFEKEHKQLNRNSLFGSFLIDLNTSEKKELCTSQSSSPKMSILCTILLSNDYTLCLDKQLKDNIKETRQRFSSFQRKKKVEDDLLIEELVENDKVLRRNNAFNSVKFATDDVRHQVMSYFVRTCLVTDEDYLNYINLSSVDSLLEYVCVWGYENVEEERCLHLPERIENIYIEKLDVYILCHVNMEMLCQESRNLADKLQLPPAVVKMTQGTKKKFCNFVKALDEEHEHQMNRSSLLGSFLIELNTSKKREFFTSPPSSTKMSILYTILLSNGYTLSLDKQFKNTIKKTRERLSVLQNNETVEDDILIKELVEKDKVLMRNSILNNVQFATDDVRHQVMSYFIRTCLVTDEDYNNYIDLASVDSLLEYICVWGYENGEEERCLHLPERIENIYIGKLEEYIICHINLEMIRQKGSDLANKFHIPIEVLEWDREARGRYVACLKKGTQMVHRARAMIVGCAGAGKTTLLERLQNHNIDKLKEIESTVGLEVYENIFEIENNSLKALSENLNDENKCLLSVVDFAGQCAYYACHQIYLSKRAFYLLVIDRSKPFQTQVDRELCEQEGTMFSDWTYGQYIIFWLKSIHTYCDDDTPVITIATHCDRVQNVGESIYDDLLELLKDEPELKMHIESSRCFHIGFPVNANEPIDKLTDIEACIASIALEDRWKETIPGDWASCQAAFRENKQRGKRMISLSNFKKQVSSKLSKNDEETFDMLRFYNDIGIILHFNEEDLKDKTIIDVQWFVDCFKNIITDPKHARKVAKDDTHWQFYNKSGYLSEELLHQIWRKTKMDLRKCKPTLKYMQRLGLVAVGKEFHYIPCMNKLDVGDGLKKYLLNLSQKSSVLIFKFEFLPHFFYFRLVVACMVDANWAVVEDTGQKYVFKSAVCLRFQDHLIVLAVTMTTIQIQLFRQGDDDLSFVVTNKICDTIIEILKRLTKNFHKKTLYSKGYQCSKQNVFEELASCFLLEDEIYRKGQITCPRHGGVNHHSVKEKDLLLYWMYGEETSFHEKEVQIPEKLYRSLIADLVNNYLDVSVDNGHVFRTWKQCFKFQYSAPRYHSATVDEDFNTLERDGKLSLNNYETLKEILKDVDHRALRRVEEHEKKLKTLLRQK